MITYKNQATKCMTNHYECHVCGVIPMDGNAQQQNKDTCNESGIYIFCVVTVRNQYA